MPRRHNRGSVYNVKAFILKTIFVLTALSLIPAAAIVGTSQQANAQANSAEANFDTASITCGDEGWLKQALGRYGKAIDNFKYTGNIDKDSAAAMQLITTANLRASQYAAKCGSNDKMKAMAQKQSDAQIQQLQNLKAMQATMGGA